MWSLWLNNEYKLLELNSHNSLMWSPSGLAINTGLLKSKTVDIKKYMENHTIHSNSVVLK